MRRPTAKVLLNDALAELRLFVAGEMCDHSVGICYCSTYRLMDEIGEYLEKYPNKREV